ncbi:MAG: GIY-YIG nuclease family protein [Candidatus Tantalella remota]|nr:GIY-YIG nuclease family protein [Candidatus Tantalella remota]
MSSTWYLYILRCSDDTLYTGITTDIARRIDEHNTSKKGSACVRGRRPVKLAYSETFPDRSSALKREAEIKTLPKKDKEALVLSV